MIQQEMFSVYYPAEVHPLSAEKDITKSRYLALMECFRNQFIPNDSAAEMRLKRFSQLLLGNKNIEITTSNSDNAEKAILKTRFSPFRIFSYRYIFLFDCIFLLAPSNIDLANNFCAELKSKINSRYHKRMDNIVQQMFSSNPVLPDKSIVTKELFDAWIRTRVFLQSQESNIIFTATMSAGKSTLINAVVGQELSNSQKAACTASVLEFKSAPNYYSLYNIIADNSVIPNQSIEDIHTYTKKRENPCTIIGYFESPLTQYKISLLDTPGVNSSQNPKHKEITRSELLTKHHDIIVYVIPVESYGSDDDYFHLKFIKEKVKYTKILFAVNMMDTCDLEDDSFSEIVADIKQHLTSIGFDAPQVCPVSAKAGLLFKQGLAGCNLAPNTQVALKTLFQKFSSDEYDLSTFYPAVQKHGIHCDNYTITDIPAEQLYQAFLRTGVPELEDLLFSIIKEA